MTMELYQIETVHYGTDPDDYFPEGRLMERTFEPDVDWNSEETAVLLEAESIDDVYELCNHDTVIVGLPNQVWHHPSAKFANCEAIGETVTDGLPSVKLRVQIYDGYNE